MCVRGQSVGLPLKSDLPGDRGAPSVATISAEHISWTRAHAGEGDNVGSTSNFRGNDNDLAGSENEEESCLPA